MILRNQIIIIIINNLVRVMFSKLSGKKMLVQYMYHKQNGANTKHTECDLLSMNEGSLRQARNKVLQVIVPGTS